MSKIEKTRWVYSKSRISGHLKKIEGFEAWFYTGPTEHFGHYPSKKK